MRMGVDRNCGNSHGIHHPSSGPHDSEIPGSCPAGLSGVFLWSPLSYGPYTPGITHYWDWWYPWRCELPWQPQGSRDALAKIRPRSSPRSPEASSSSDTPGLPAHGYLRIFHSSEHIRSYSLLKRSFSSPRRSLCIFLPACNTSSVRFYILLKLISGIISRFHYRINPYCTRCHFSA